VLLWKYWRQLSEVDKIIWSYKKGIKVPEELKKWKNFTVRFFEGEEDKSWKRREVRPYHNYGGKIPIAQSTDITNRYPCYHPFLAPAVRANGDMVICCADPEGKSVVGNVSNMKISEAWKLMDKTRKEHKNGIYSGICERCDVWAFYPSLF
jgi:radical SAM protein with 4Fe4S-binding SPASM domain